MVDSIERAEVSEMAGPGSDTGSGNDSGNDSGWMADVFAKACPSRGIMEQVVSKWGTLALLALNEGAYRFNALRRKVDGVSEKMLAQTLHGLERDGLVSRDVQATIPPRVEYSLTDLGAQVAARLAELVDVLETRMPDVLDARDGYDRAKASTGN